MTPNRKDTNDRKNVNDRKETKETVKKAVADVAKAFVIGVIAAAVLSVILFANS